MRAIAFLITLLVTSNFANADQWVKVCNGNGTCSWVRTGSPVNYQIFNKPVVKSVKTYDSYVQPYTVVSSTPVVETKKTEIKKAEVKKVENVQPKKTEVKPFIVAPVVEVQATTMKTQIILK
jgi:hypothetical protein